MGITPSVIACEGLDRIGKSSLIQGIQDRLGYYQVIHFSKPERLAVYELAAKLSSHQGDGYIFDVPQKSVSAFLYQEESFRNSMIMARSGARIIFDRWHLGETVYAPLYRGYSGDYVFQLERNTELNNADIRLILLYEDFRFSKHFVDDGLSLGSKEKRDEEQQRFVNAWNRSHIRDKRIICVTDLNTGEFRAKEDILAEALA